MRFDGPLLTGRLLRRYKRFMADIELDDGTVVTAHCPNSGSLMGLKEPGLEVWLTHHDDPKRKLKYTWEMLRIDGALVGINTHRPNAIVAEAIAAGVVPELAGYAGMRREVRYGSNSRIDILLEEGPDPRPCYVEVKNVHLRRDRGAVGIAEFPDSVTTRGAKHLRDLAEQVVAGCRSVMVFLVQRDDCQQFRLAGDIDPDYAAGFLAARDAGVEAICLGCALDGDGIRVDRRLAFDPPG